MKNIKIIVYGVILCIGGLAYAEPESVEQAVHEQSQELLDRHKSEHKDLQEKQAKEREELGKRHKAIIDQQTKERDELKNNPEKEQEYQKALRDEISKSNQVDWHEVNLNIGTPEERYKKRLKFLDDNYREDIAGMKQKHNFEKEEQDKKHEDEITKEKEQHDAKIADDKRIADEWDAMSDASTEVDPLSSRELRELEDEFEAEVEDRVEGWLDDASVISKDDREQFSEMFSGIFDDVDPSNEFVQAFQPEARGGMSEGVRGALEQMQDNLVRSLSQNPELVRALSDEEVLEAINNGQVIMTGQPVDFTPEQRQQILESITSSELMDLFKDITPKERTMLVSALVVIEMGLIGLFVELYEQMQKKSSKK